MKLYAEDQSLKQGTAGVPVPKPSYLSLPVRCYPVFLKIGDGMEMG